MKQLLNNRFGWMIVLAGLVLLNILAYKTKLRADLTAEKRFSLASSTKSQLKSLEGTISVDVLMKGDYPAVFRKLKSSTADMLEEMKAYAGNRLSINFIKPGEGLSDTAQQKLFDSLKAMGIQPYTLQVQQKEGEQSQRLIYPAALVKYGSRVIPIDLLSGKTEYSRDALTGRLQLDEAKSISNAEALLEYKFADAFDKIQRTKKPLVGYLVGNGEPTGPETYDLVQTLEKNYQLQLIDPNKNPVIPTEFSAILIVKPSQKFSDSVKMRIDQYLMQGGKILWFLDMLYAEKDSLAITSKTLAYDRGLELDDLLFRYGVRVNRNLLQNLPPDCDLSKMVVGNAGGQPQLADVPFNYYPLLNPAQGHPVTKNLEPVLGQFVNTIDTVKAEGISKKIVLTSSENSKTVSTPAVISLQELKTIEEPKLYNKNQLPVALLLEGRFKSFYSNRASEEIKNYFRQYYGSFETVSKKITQQLVAGDGDLLLNGFTQQEPFPMGFSRVQEKTFANSIFLQNILELFTGNAAILNLRNKELSLRLLNPEKLQNQRTTWQLVNIITPFLLVITGGFLFSWWRKRKYAQTKRS